MDTLVPLDCSLGCVVVCFESIKKQGLPLVNPGGRKIMRKPEKLKHDFSFFMLIFGICKAPAVVGAFFVRCLVVGCSTFSFLCLY